MAVLLGAIKQKYFLNIYASKNKVSGGEFKSIAAIEKYLKKYLKTVPNDLVRKRAEVSIHKGYRDVKRGSRITRIFDTEIVKVYNLD